MVLLFRRMIFLQEFRLLFILYHVHSVLASVIPAQEVSTLYTEGEGGIHNLDTSNFSDFTKENIGIIQYYLSNCGTCRAFAPIFLEGNRVLQNTQEFFTPFVVNCALQKNNPICTDPAYPTIKCSIPTKNIISSLKKFSDAKGYLAEIAKCLVEDDSVVQKVLQGSSHQKSDQYYKLYGSVTNEIFRICLRFYNVVNLRCEHSSLLGPGLFNLEINNNLIQSEKNEDQIVNYLDSTRTGTTELPIQVAPTKSEIDRSFKPLYGVYAADIVTALHNLFTTHVPLRKHISGRAKDALVEFLQVLYDIFPLNRYYKTSLSELINFLNDRESITADEWSSALTQFSYPSLEPGYVGCKGSSPKYRGFPCGLWTTFHALTVAEHLKTPTSEPRVPHAMNRLIAYFFSCTECAIHFATVSQGVLKQGEPVYPEDARPEDLAAIAPSEKINLPTPPTNTMEAILWLNEVHNRVNMRLKGSPSEDPMVPKVIFPCIKICPQCYSHNGSNSSFPDHKWPDRVDNLLHFLIHLFRPCSWNLEFTGLDIIDVTCDPHDKLWWLIWMVPIALAFTVLCILLFLFFMLSHGKLRSMRRRPYPHPPHCRRPSPPKRPQHSPPRTQGGCDRSRYDRD